MQASGEKRWVKRSTNNLTTSSTTQICLTYWVSFIPKRYTTSRFCANNSVWELGLLVQVRNWRGQLRNAASSFSKTKSETTSTNWSNSWCSSEIAWTYVLFGALWITFMKSSPSPPFSSSEPESESSASWAALKNACLSRRSFSTYVSGLYTITTRRKNNA